MTVCQLAVDDGFIGDCKSVAVKWGTSSSGGVWGMRGVTVFDRGASLRGCFRVRPAVTVLQKNHLGGLWCCIQRARSSSSRTTETPACRPLMSLCCSKRLKLVFKLGSTVAELALRLIVVFGPDLWVVASPCATQAWLIASWCGLSSCADKILSINGSLPCLLASADVLQASRAAAGNYAGQDSGKRVNKHHW